MDIILLFLITFLASTIHGLTGFGYAIVSMPLLLIIFPYKTVAAVVAFIDLFLSLQLTWKLRKSINMRIILPVLLTCILGRGIGINVVMSIDEDILKISLGIVLILFSIYFHFYKEKIKIKPTFMNGIITGLSSGVLAGLFNTGGPPLVLYYSVAARDKMEYNSSLQVIFAVSALYAVITHIIYGNINPGTIPLIGAGIVAMFAWSVTGFFFFNKIRDFNKVIYFSMVLFGIFLIFMGIV